MYQRLSLLAFTIGILLIGYQLFKLKYRFHELVILLLSTLISFFIGARLLNYFVNYTNYKDLNIPPWSWRYAGFSVYGGILLSLCALYVLHRLLHRDIWSFADTLWLPFGISFAIMRFACLLNGCCYGQPSNLPWAMTLKTGSPEENLLNRFLGLPIPIVRVHPTQAYEMIGALLPILFLFIWRSYARKHLRIIPSGVLALSYGIAFTSMRLLILPLRDLPYKIAIRQIVYPVFYYILIFIASLLIFWRYQTDKHKGDSDDTRT
jgi:phosphatidylglycerol---prolipoprotein diacylglyceryl transferase